MMNSMVDETRVSVGLNEIIIHRRKHEASRVQDNIKHDQLVDITATKVGHQLIFLLPTATICGIMMN